VGNICPEGHICGEGTTPEQQTAIKCFDGFFCKSSTTPSSVYEDLCIPGFYCGEATTFVNRYKFRCPRGFYCPSGTGSKSDLKRTLLRGEVFLTKADFYLSQKVAQFCVRQLMRNKFEYVVVEQAELQKAGLPPIDNKEISDIRSSWMKEFDANTCQEQAVYAVWKRYHPGQDPNEYIETIQSMEFFTKQLLTKVLKEPQDYINKCSEHSEILEGKPWPTVNCQEAVEPCNNVSQLECLCSAGSVDKMMDCFGTDNGYSDPQCVEDPSLKDAVCLDPSVDLTPDDNGQIGSLDDFDLMAGHFLSYVQSSLQEEMQTRISENQGTTTRCPFGTMTKSDGASGLGDCVKRSNVDYVQEQLDMVVERINPVDTYKSPAQPVKTSGNAKADQGKFWPVYKALAGSVSLITFDVRHLPRETRYGDHWRIKVLLQSQMDPRFNDAIDCDWLVANKRTPDRDIDVITAESRGCAELGIPVSFTNQAQAAAQSGTPIADGVFTFMIHPLIDCEWRIEVQIVDGVFQPDAFMLLSSAIVEYVEPARAEVDTTKSWAIMISKEMTLELPTNMPLKSFNEDNQRVLTKAFLNWLPVTAPLENFMRPLAPESEPVAAGEKEYVHPEKSTYFKSNSEILIPYLPYFSNCRGFGRTIPLWAITEQARGCKWAPEGGEIGLLSLGAQAKGDSCGITEVECLLDEIPNVKMGNPRWFEAKTGAKLFEVTKDAVSAGELPNSLGQNKPVTEPVYLRSGVPGGSGVLPGRVTLAFEYWQRGPKEKMLAAGRAWYSDFSSNVAESVLAGKSSWKYKLTVLYYPMSHFEVMVNFAFPFSFYFMLYFGMGCLSVGMVACLWCYHRFMCRLAYPPKLDIRRHWDVFLAPQLRGLGMVASVCTAPVIMGLLLFAGKLASLPWADDCDGGQQEADCIKGLLDHVSSSYGGETAVTTTTYGDRREGRAGIMFCCIGGYAIAASLKLLVPAAESNYYKREDKTGASRLKEIIKEQEEEDKGDADTDAQTNAGEEEEDEMPPIFTTHMWKRSSLGLLVYGNAALQISLLRMSFSDQFKQNILIFLVLLFIVRLIIKIAFTHYICESMLVVAISLTNQVIAIFTLLASPTLFDFLVSYVALIGFQMVERIYIGPNEDVIMGKFNQLKGSIDNYLRTLKKSGAGEDEDIDSDDEGGRIADVDEAEEEGENEELISFLSTLSADGAANLVIPMLFSFCMFMPDESQILNSFGIPTHNAQFFLIFYIMMLPFQAVADKICINICECYHGWKVTDYLEYCAYRYIIRTADWKGNDNVLDQTLSPHVRSIDQMCFSDQYYFVNLLQAFGTISWFFGMQILFVAEWNVFDDPATPLILFLCLCMCKGTHSMTLVSAGYLRVWVVTYKTFAQAGYQQAMMKGVQAMGALSNDEKPPAPPPGSVHDGWPEPPQYDKTGMERYRAAFMAENQLWLQVAVSEMKDKRLIQQTRGDLLHGLANLLNEVSPEDYAPEGVEGIEKDTFAFGAAPPLDLARAAGEVQRETYENSALRQLIRMWRERAQFMLHLQQVSAVVKLNNYQRRDACEICGKNKEMTSLVVLPIYTMLHLASLYREQRDMSPLWNTQLWKHFYQTFTPTCTLCEDCAKFYHKRNTNIPVNEKRFQRLQVKKKTAYELMRRSEYPIVPLDADLVKVLRLWLSWTRAFCNDEQPKDFLPRFGFDGRTAAEIRREAILQKAGDDDEDLPELEGDAEEVDDDNESKSSKEAAGDAAKKKKFKDPALIEMDAEDLAKKLPLRVPKTLKWSEETIMKAWLARARQSMQAPSTSSWAYAGEAQQAQSSASGAASSSQNRPDESAGRGVRFSSDEEAG